MEKLELKHITPYLPYELKVKTNLGVLELTAIDNFGTYKYWCGYNGNTSIKQFNTKILIENGLRSKGFSSGEIKPILRPLKDLSKDYSFKGETQPYYWFISLDNSRERKELLMIQKGTFLLDDVSYSIVESLIQEHFDVFGLIEKGLALDINTLKQK